MPVNLETPIRTFAPSGRKVSRKSRNFFSHSVEPPPTFVNRWRHNARIPHRFRENWNKIDFFTFFSSYKNFSHAKFWYKLLDGAYCRWWKFERNRDSQFREKSTSAFPLWKATYTVYSVYVFSLNEVGVSML